MSQSPLSPVGKRMRTMEESDDTDDDDLVRSIYFQSAQGYQHDATEGDRFMDEKNETSTDEDEDDWVDLEEHLGDLARTMSDFDDEDESDEEDDDDDESYSRDSLTSGYAGLNDENVAIEIISDSDDGMDDEYLEYDSDEDDDIDHCLPDQYLKHDPTPDTQYPKPEWITVNELRQRRLGLNSTRQSRQSHRYWFERYVNRSLWMIQRLELTKRLDGHTGSVNCIDFNSSGNLICSGSDDLSICIWDWQMNKLRKKINTGHTNNVFHSQFCKFDTNIVTTSRDGTVRLLDIERNHSEQLLSTSGEIGKVAFITPQTLVTCGTNAFVNFVDLRMPEPVRLFIVRNPKNNRSCALHTINSHPLDNHKIVVAGASPYVFLYDLRRVAMNQNIIDHKPTYYIDKFEDTNNIVTSTAFNSIGDKLLISYNDDDLFVCRTDTCELIHRYKGHRNKKTIKGCAWFGDNYVLSGSDDGHIYGWDLQSEHIVCFLEGDVKGVVNCLSVHPNLPILASSGLDHNVKVWEPISKIWPQTLKGIKPQICKNTMRRKMARSNENPIPQSEDDYSISDLFP